MIHMASYTSNMWIEEKNIAFFDTIAIPNFGFWLRYYIFKKHLIHHNMFASTRLLMVTFSSVIRTVSCVKGECKTHNASRRNNIMFCCVMSRQEVFGCKIFPKRFNASFNRKIKSIHGVKLRIIQLHTCDR